MFDIKIPEGVREIMDKLASSGINSWLVGGCVRDALLGRTANDWDIAAGALPDDIICALDAMRVIPTGIQHGTVTVVINGECFEVTACRSDGEYADMRRPESVSFTESIESDLSRRDFTVNAMAYNKKDGLIDLFGGYSDLRSGIIRCVGDPEKRFSEDALRIIRALRFSSELGFAIDDKTAAAAVKLKNNLNAVSQERRTAELSRLLTGKNASSVLIKYRDIIFVLMPECAGLAGVPHRHGSADDLWIHCSRSVDLAPSELHIRFAALLRDIGKPYCIPQSNNYAGHAEKGAEIAEHMLHRMKLDRISIKKIVTLIENHSVVIEPDECLIRTLLSRLGEEMVFDLYNLRSCDRSAHMNEEERIELEKIDSAYELTNMIISRGDCYKLSALSVRGDDLMKLGYNGKEVGTVLKKLLDRVISGECVNERAVLLSQIKKTGRDNARCE